MLAIYLSLEGACTQSRAAKQAPLFLYGRKKTNPEILIFAFIQTPKCYSKLACTFSSKSCHFAFPPQQEEVASLTHAVICTCASEEPDLIVLECISLQD